MSAFLCDEITINRIVSYLLEDAWGADEFNPILRQHGFNLRLGTVSAPGPSHSLAYALRMLNLYALECRYSNRYFCDCNFDAGDGCECDLTPPEFTPHVVRNPNINPDQFAYTLSCLHYQCSEGDALDKPLGKALEALSELACAKYNKDLVGDSAEYWR